jgi:hypothetical protein
VRSARVAGEERRAPARSGSEAPDPDAEVLTRYGDPAFEVRLAQPVQADVDVPEEVGLALHRGAVVLYLDTDGGASTEP